MKKLKKFLIPFLLCSILCFSFIPKTYAAESTNVTMYATSHSIVEPYNQINEYNNSSYIQLGDSQFIKFKALQFNNIYISKVCEGQKYYYRFDYQIWGWHNETKTTRDWVNFAKGLFTYPNLNVLGSIIDIPNGYTLNISTFIEWELPTSSECVTQNLDLFQLNFSDKLTDFYFYNSFHFDSTIYTIYNSTYEITSPAYAQQLIDSYYDTGNINSEKLDEISGKLIDVNENLEQTNQKLEDIYSDITNNDISGSQNTANGFFDNFTDNDYGLSSIITIPLSSIQKITNSTCSPINIPVPFTNKNISLPCMGTLYQQNVPVLLNIWQVVSFGIISYAIIVDIFAMVKKFKDPNDDKLEVMDL